MACPSVGVPFRHTLPRPTRDAAVGTVEATGALPPLLQSLHSRLAHLCPTGHSLFQTAEHRGNQRIQPVCSPYPCQDRDFMGGSRFPPLATRPQGAAECGSGTRCPLCRLLRHRTRNIHRALSQCCLGQSATRLQPARLGNIARLIELVLQLSALL